MREILPFWVSTRQRQNDMNGARVRSSLQNPTLAEHEIFRTHVSARPLHDQIQRELMSANDEALSVAMYVNDQDFRDQVRDAVAQRPVVAL